MYRYNRRPTEHQKAAAHNLYANRASSPVTPDDWTPEQHAQFRAEAGLLNDDRYWDNEFANAYEPKHISNPTAANSGDLLRRARRYLDQWSHVPPPNLRTGGESSPQLVQALAEQIEKLQDQLDDANSLIRRFAAS